MQKVNSNLLRPNDLKVNNKSNSSAKILAQKTFYMIFIVES